MCGMLTEFSNSWFVKAIRKIKLLYITCVAYSTSVHALVVYIRGCSRAHFQRGKECQAGKFIVNINTGVQCASSGPDGSGGYGD